MQMHKSNSTNTNFKNADSQSSESKISDSKNSEPGTTRANRAIGKIRRKNEAVIIESAIDEFIEFGYDGASMKNIALRAGLPRANIHYYFKNKLVLYTSILGDIIDMWNISFDAGPDSEPADVLSQYIHSKVMYSCSHPRSSRLFASELLRGAPHLSDYLQEDFRHWINGKCELIQHWIEQGKMDPIEPMNLLFFIWGSSQHFADFQVQVLAAAGKSALAREDFERIAHDLTQLVLKGCGIASTQQQA